MGDCGMDRRVSRLRLRAKSLIILAVLIGESISRQQGWEYLKQMRQRLRVPRQSHQEADPNEQEAWKKKLATVVEQVQNDHPDADVEEECGAGDAIPSGEDEQRKRTTTSQPSNLGGRGVSTCSHS